MSIQTISNGWKKVKLGEVVEVISGYAFKSKDFINDGIPVIKIKNIKEGYIDIENDIQYIADTFKSKIPEKFIVKKGDILISLTGSHISQWESVVGRVGKYYYDIESFLNQRAGKIIIKGNIDKRYIYYFLFSYDTRYKIASLSKGAASQANISPNDIYSLDILLPPLPIQQKIASILSKYDEIIENNNKRIKILEQMGKAIFYDMMKQAEEKGELEEVKVKEIIIKIPTGKKYNSKTVSKEGKVPVLDQGRSGIIGYHNDEPGVIANPDDPVITFANHTCYQNLIMFPFSTIQNVFAFVPKHGLDIYWLYYATKGLISFYDYKGHFPEFLEKKAFIPKNLSYSKKFGEIASKLHKEIYNLQLQNQNLKQTRDLLIPRLVSGELEVEEMEIK